MGANANKIPPVKVRERLTSEEANNIILMLDGAPKLVVQLVSISGLRISEVLRLRVSDLYLDYEQFTVHSDEASVKEGKHRIIGIPKKIMPSMLDQLGRVKLIH